MAATGEHRDATACRRDRRRVEPGDDGTGCDGLHAADAALCGVSCRAVVLGTRPRYRRRTARAAREGVERRSDACRGRFAGCARTYAFGAPPGTRRCIVLETLAIPRCSGSHNAA